MSQYPYNPGWGYNHPYPAPAPPPPPQQYGYQNHPPSYPPPPVYGQPYEYEYNVPPPAAEIHHNASHQSYDYNATNIPGLGVGGVAPGEPPYNVGFTPNAWPQQQQHSPFPPYNQNPPPFAAHPPQQLYNSQQPQFIPPAAAPSTYHKPPQPQIVPEPVPQAAQPMASIEMEEGELSECQFEDLYSESRESSQPAAGASVDPPTAISSAPLSKVIASANPSQPTSAADTPDGGFYENDENEDGEVSVAPNNTDRERTKSYSPFFSPAESEQNISQDAPVSRSNIQTQVASSQEGHVDIAPPGLQLSASQHTNTLAGDHDPKLGTSAQQDPVDYMSSFKSVREAKKEAQKAILRLWPLGVKFQNYIEEGFDQQVIKNLFGDLNLDMPKTPTESPSSQPKDSQSPKPDQAVEVQQKPSVAAPPDSTAMPEKSKGEERKDRIARLLALKAAKGSATTAPKTTVAPPKPDSQQTDLEPQPQNTASVPPGAPKTKHWDEKNRLLQAKIAALQAKTQQKTASEKANSDKTNPSLGQTNTGGGHIQFNQPQPGAFIPGLSQSPGPQTHSTNQRKRPVAADFVEYQSATGPLKRPFGQIRKETSLIIDVSDASDDGEMDMDLGSPDEDASFPPSRVPSLPRGASIRDFPPLTPVPSQTPPGGHGNGKKRDTELSLKEKEIQEIKRKIALAEAKRKAKQSSVGSLTPVHANQTPELKSAKLPQFPHRGREPGSSPAVSEPESISLKMPKTRLDPLQRAERRGRIFSLDLPRVDSSLEEKLNRLQRLREEEARLQAEISKELTEKKLLAEELEQLDTSSTSTPNTNGVAAVLEPGTSVSQSGDVPVDVAMAFSSEGSAPPSESQAPGDVSMGEDVRSPKEPQRDMPFPKPLEPETVAENVIASADAGQTEPDIIVTETVEHGLEKETPALQSESISSESRTADESPPTTDLEQQASDADGMVLTPAADEAPEVAQPTQSEAPAVSQTSSLDLHDPEDSAKNDETIPMDLESRSPSPEAPTPTVAVSDTSEARQSSMPVLEHISGVAGPREEVEEIEAQAAGEVNVANQVRSSAQDNSALLSYESPLRYFHAYRFHPDYFKKVPGGLKSLTYTNKIDPNKELCPHELRHEQCPADCQFQHFKSIEVPENQILLELGNSDHVRSDQKARFINGLRELLRGFKAKKVKDFDVIARGIIEYRSQFLGDQSKVLNLDGVSI
ncbi:protein red1 [Cladorrhinum sp. PSN332]|nr:protein red1 [Cladorrhinum sp. PSN332]